MTNRRMGDFELLELLGEGAMGKVYRARDVHLDRSVALKLLGERTFGDPTYIDRFKREARLAAQLNHPNIATIYAFGEDDGEAYIAMEFVEGETLEEHIKRRGPLGVPEVKKYGRQAAEALAVAHAMGIVHRDIKSANLMLTGEDNLKVLDFGVARRTGETQLTQAGSLIGTANIMAPELIRGEEATPAADIFSLGCVLYEALAGTKAFEGDDPMAVLYKIVHDEPKPLGEGRPDIPPSLLEIIQGMLVKDFTQRLGPASVVANALSDQPTAVLPAGGTLVMPADETGTLVMSPEAGDRLVPEEPVTPVPDSPAPSPSQPKSRKWLAIGGAVVGLMAISTTVVLLTGSEPPVDPAAVTQEGQRIVKANPGIPDSLNEAARLFEAATKADPEYSLAWSNLGEIHRQQGELQKAITELARAVELDNESYYAHHNLGAAYFESGELDSAATHLRRAIGLDSRNMSSFDFLGRVLEQLGEPEQAELIYRDAIDKHPENPSGFNNLAYLFLQREMPDSAVAVLEPVMNKFPLAALFKNLGLARLRLDELDAAEGAFEKAIATEGVARDVEQQAQAGLAHVYEKRGDLPRAKLAWANLEQSPVASVAEEAADAVKRLEGSD